MWLEKSEVYMADISKILVVGYGSMGRRRIRLTKDLLPDVSFVCVDTNSDRQKQAQEAGHSVYASIDDGIMEHPDAAFVCTSPGHHADIIIPLLNAGIHVFTELNLTSDRYEEISEISGKKNSVVFLSSTLVYKKQMQFFKNTVSKQRKPIAYIYHVGQYLPDWHPWESYKDFFAGHKEKNGVRELMAIQLPWIIDTFGTISSVKTIKQRCTNLEIDFADSIILTIAHDNGNIGTFLVDIVSRTATTHLEIIGEDTHVVWDGHNNDLFSLNLETKEMEPVVVYEAEEHIEGYSDNIAEQPYRDEISEFFKVIDGIEVRYGIAEDTEVLKIIDEIEDIH